MNSGEVVQWMKLKKKIKIGHPLGKKLSNGWKFWWTHIKWIMTEPWKRLKLTQLHCINRRMDELNEVEPKKVRQRMKNELVGGENQTQISSTFGSSSIFPPSQIQLFQFSSIMVEQKRMSHSFYTSWHLKLSVGGKMNEQRSFHSSCLHHIQIFVHPKQNQFWTDDHTHVLQIESVQLNSKHNFTNNYGKIGNYSKIQECFVCLFLSFFHSGRKICGQSS